MERISQPFDEYTYYKDTLDIFELVKTMKKLDPDSFDESFFICDVSEALNNYEILKKYMPRILPFYAVKCNNNNGILEVLANSGANFDCASKQEIMQIRNFGVEAERIIYAHPMKQISHLKYAKSQGVKKLTFDCQKELLKIKHYYPEAELILRIRYDAENSRLKLGLKYGCDPIEEAPKLLILAKKLNLKVIGVSFHVGCVCLDYSTYAKAIEAVRGIFDYAFTIGMSLTLVDIGGGYPGDVKSLKKIAAVVNDAIESFFPDDNITIISEPGRFIASSSMTLVSKIQSLREVSINGNLDTMMYFINDSVFGAFCNVPYGEIQSPPDLILSDNDIVVGEYFKSIIWGQTCDSSDKIVDNALLPKMDINDVLVFMNLGAYTVPLLTSFNGFPVPDIKMFLNIKHKYLINKNKLWAK